MENLFRFFVVSPLLFHLRTLLQVQLLLLLRKDRGWRGGKVEKMHVYTREGISRRCDCGHARFEQVVEMYRCVRRGRERRQGISDVLVHGANISGASRRWKAPKRRGATPGARHNAASTQPPPLLNFPSPRPSTLLPLLFLLPSFFLKERERKGDFYSSCNSYQSFLRKF